MDLRPGIFNINAYKNDTLSLIFELNLNGDPIDLSNSSVRMYIRPTAASNTLSLSIEEGTGITVTANPNNFQNIININKVITLAAGEYVYDLEITTGSVVRTYLKGEFTVTQDISR